MKKLLVFSCLTVFIFGIVGTAGALVCTDIYDPNPNVYLRGGLFGQDDAHTWTFNIADNGDNGFNPAAHDVVAAEVRLALLDDPDGCVFWEIATLDAGDNTFWWEVNTGDIAFGVESLITLNENGTLLCTLTARWGDFYLDQACLLAEVIDNPIAPVPEPSVMLLLGCGFVCVAGFGWKRFSKKLTADRQ